MMWVVKVYTRGLYVPSLCAHRATSSSPCNLCLTQTTHYLGRFYEADLEFIYCSCGHFPMMVAFSHLLLKNNRDAAAANLQVVKTQKDKGCGRQHRGVCFNISTRNILRGNIMDSAADVSLFLHAWNWGWALWSKWKCTAEVCNAARLMLYTESEMEPVPRTGFPRSPAECTFFDPSSRNTMAHHLDPSLPWLSLWPVGISVETLWPSANSGQPPEPARFLPPSSILDQLCSINSL